MEDGLGLRFGADLSAYAATNTTTVGETRNGTETEHDNNEEEDGQAWEEDELPIISIELERLVGFKPSSRDEMDAIRKQLLEAMWMRYKASRGEKDEKEETANDDDDEEEEPPPDFDDQIKELLDSRVARFGSIQNTYLGEEEEEDAHETSAVEEKPLRFKKNGKNNPGPFLEITYPSRVVPPNGSSHERILLRDTAKLWSEIRSLAYALDEEDGGESEEHHFWYNLSDHLEHTGRLLSWKHSMALELKDMLNRELLYKNHQLWVKEQRTAKLEQLYQVRETLVHRKEVAQGDFEKLQSQKETAIRRDMLLYDNSIKRKHKDDSLLGGGGMSFPEEFELMGLMPKDAMYEEEDWGGTLDDEDDFDYYNSDYSDGYSDEDDEDDLSGYEEEGGGDDQAIDPLPLPKATKEASDDEKDDSPIAIPPTRELPEIEPVDSSAILPTTSVPRPFLRRNKARRKKKARAQKKRELAEAKRKEEQKLRTEHEALVQAKHTTNELVLAQTLLDALEQKVSDVEELLENLQEEEWAAAEEEDAEKEEEEPVPEEGKLSLLDQILAMILGALPMEPGSKDKEGHFQYIKKEHEFIVQGWKEYFGRLPSAHVPGEAKPKEEEDENDETSAPETEPKPSVGYKAPPTSHKLTTISSSKKSSTSTTPSAPTTTPQEQRMALGIVDNEDGDWEDEDDE